MTRSQPRRGFPATIGPDFLSNPAWAVLVLRRYSKGGFFMRTFYLIFGLWVLWLYSSREYVTLGTYSSFQECNSAKTSDQSGIMLWKTECKESTK
ncbi:hypothetical protein BES34_005125 [Leptospira inadai serovar Lyme]|uniref:Uncharacterized protein n=1 Tax=Leptospira inadai serovar Lyme TaxID=293084 RepID=A0ABX4YKV2_9LEPT|nr:hypothetical protein BES34_005125 [Leptospira inadai serovar Lyme]